MSLAPTTRKPEWLRVPAPGGDNYKKIKAILADRKLHTVCEEARCPNIGECWSGGTATFMLLGDVCTRGCKFCAVTTGNPRMQLDPHEPEKIADSIRGLGLRYIVLTSVDRDDLPDQGVAHFCQTVRLAKNANPGLLVEVLTPDWRGNESLVAEMARSGADVLAHNIETVERLQLRVRDPRATYAQSMRVLELYKSEADAAGLKVLTKSSIMLGLGERDDEVFRTMRDLRAVGVRVLTFGQYLQPTPRHLAVEEYVRPEKFEYFAREGEAMGFAYVASGPLVRSSYKAGEFYVESLLRGTHADASNGALVPPVDVPAELA